MIVCFLFLILAGLARKEDFPYIAYYCPHCHALNRPKNSEQPLSGNTSPEMDPTRPGSGGNGFGESPKGAIAPSGSAQSESEIVEAVERACRGGISSPIKSC